MHRAARSTHAIRTSLIFRLVAATLTAAGALCVVFGSPASASTTDGVATVTTPGTFTALASGGSTTLFTVGLPANAACSGDTATGNYHVFSYMLPKGTSLSTVSFTTGLPSTGYGLVDNTGSYYGAVNTAITTGQITGIPNNFEWAPVVTNSVYSVAQLTAQPWEVGLACADVHGVVSDNWNTELTFTAAGSDPTGFTWSAVPGGNAVTTTTTTTTTTGGTTTTTAAPTDTTTTTTAASTTTTTTTAAGAATAATNSGSGTSSGDPSSGGSVASSSGTGAGSTGNLAFTGVPVAKGVGLGLLGIGLGFILLSRGPRRRLTHAHAHAHSSPGAIR